MAAVLGLENCRGHPHVTGLSVYLHGFDGFRAMPIYEYRCNACGHELERLQRMSDAPLTDCPECGAAKLRRLVSAAAFRLKGGGWYETDFKKDGKRNLHDSHGAKSDAGEKAGSDKASGDKAGSEKKDSAKSAEVKKQAKDSAAKPSAA
jgi:putative FmdB family regulatory protein